MEERVEQRRRGGYPLLDRIASPLDLRGLSSVQLPSLCQEIRECLIDTLSEVGGHFASNLGVVELTVALHYVFETPRDRLIWDVGHQIYPHKLLTGRKERLSSVRKIDGLSGFPKREESIYDLYNTGHAGTSISQLLGEALARDHLGENHHCISVIGDASISSGMAFEALNHGGHTKTDCIVVLNDNDMSISHNVGALNQYLNRLITNPLYNQWMRFCYTLMMWLPVVGPALRTFSKRIERSVKDLLTPGGFFADLGFRYVGPVDGHNIFQLVEVLRKLKQMKGPLLLHVYTQKGKGYQPAERDPIQYHSVSLFDRNDGSFRQKADQDKISFSAIVGDTLLELAQKNRRVVAITPAMIEGSGLTTFHKAMPERVYDVGIAEQHSMTFSGALASAGMIPYLCIYSTFLNRAIDQLIQDVALMNLPIRMVIDRSGCVGADGETHQGLYDLGALLSIPNIKIYAPANGGELKAMLYYMEHHDESPIAVRFPKSLCNRRDLLTLPDVSRTDILVEIAETIETTETTETIETGSAAEAAGTRCVETEAAEAGSISSVEGKVAVIAIGAMWQTGLDVVRHLRRHHNIRAAAIGLRWIRPLNVGHLTRILAGYDYFIFIEDSYIHSSAAAYILQLLPSALLSRHLKTFAFPEKAIEHGGREQILDLYGLSCLKIAAALLPLLSIDSSAAANSGNHLNHLPKKPAGSSVSVNSAKA